MLALTYLKLDFRLILFQRIGLKKYRAKDKRQSNDFKKDTAVGH